TTFRVASPRVRAWGAAITATVLASAMTVGGLTVNPAAADEIPVADPIELVEGANEQSESDEGSTGSGTDSESAGPEGEGPEGTDGSEDEGAPEEGASGDAGESDDDGSGTDESPASDGAEGEPEANAPSAALRGFFTRALTSSVAPGNVNSGAASWGL